MGDAAWISQMQRPGGLGWDAEMLFRLVNNAFIHCLQFAFCPDILPLLHHLRANADNLQCQVGTLNIHIRKKEIDYTLIDFLGAHLKPQIYKTLILFDLREDYVMLFAHNALRAYVKHFECKLSQTPVPACILPELFGVDALHTCAISTPVDPRPWISQFIERFETAERGTDIVRSVTLLHKRLFDRSPLPRIVQPLVLPRRVDVPTPRSDFVKYWREETEKYGFPGTVTTESTVGELFVFENAKAAKKLEVLVWTIEHSGPHTALSYVYLLQVVDVPYMYG